MHRNNLDSQPNRKKQYPEKKSSNCSHGAGVLDRVLDVLDGVDRAGRRHDVFLAVVAGLELAGALLLSGKDAPGLDGNGLRPADFFFIS